jgi:hypothetical protein
MLCDELQEWNREAYGIVDRKLTYASSAAISITGERLEITYLTQKGTLPEEFSAKKESLFKRILDIEAVFAKGISVRSDMAGSVLLSPAGVSEGGKIKPRPLLENSSSGRPLGADHPPCRRLHPNSCSRSRARGEVAGSVCPATRRLGSATRET